MSDQPVPLSVLSGTSPTKPWAEIVIGKNIMTQTPAQSGYWFVVLDRSSLAIVYNQVQTDHTKAPQIGAFNTADHILIAVSAGVGLNRQPQGELYTFLDKNGAGRALRHVNQIATQLNCGSLGTFGYTLVGTLGNRNPRGLEDSHIGTQTSVAPILTVQLMPTTANGKTFYTPVQLSDA